MKRDFELLDEIHTGPVTYAEVISKATTGGNVLKRVRDVKPKQRPKANKTAIKVQSAEGKKPRGRPPKNKQTENSPAKKSAPKKIAKKQTTDDEKTVKKKPVKKTVAAKFTIEGAVI